MLRLILVSGLVVCVLAAADARAEKKKVLIVQTWSGSVEDEELRKDAPLAITSAKKFEELWKAWKAEGATPKVDFTKFLIVTAYTSGSRLNITNVTLNDDGNLEAVAISTRDLRPGFRYQLAVVSNDGVKTNNGKKLP